MAHLDLGDVQNVAPNVKHGVHSPFVYANEYAGKRKIRMRIGQPQRYRELGGMNFPQLIRAIIKTTGWDQGELAEKLSTSQASVSRYLGGRQEPDYKKGNEIIALAKSLGILSDELIASDRTMIASIVGIVGLGEQIEWAGSNDMPLGEVELPFPVREGCVALEAKGDSQFPRVRNGEILIVKFNGLVPDEVIGQEVVVRLADGTYLMKTIRRGYEAGRYNLESHNAPLRENVQIDQIATIVAIIPATQYRKL
jgi:transcriptional regulator with XRE-family HTH domain